MNGANIQKVQFKLPFNVHKEPVLNTQRLRMFISEKSKIESLHIRRLGGTMPKAVIVDYEKCAGYKYVKLCAN